ncbi:MAG: hypothetical protein K940chlam3_00036 [Chlamydiae bacterium]|nr:hypothetical protein [Chlamydiota bacterium]
MSMNLHYLYHLFSLQSADTESTSQDPTYCLPVEILYEISSYFTSKDVPSLRLVCRRWNQIVIQSWPKHIILAHEIIHQIQSHLNLREGFFGGMALKILTVRFQDPKPIVQMIDCNEMLIKHSERGYVSDDGGVTWALNHISVHKFTSLQFFRKYQLAPDYGGPDFIIGPFVKRSVPIFFFRNRVHVYQIRKEVSIFRLNFLIPTKEYRNQKLTMKIVEYVINNYSRLLFPGAEISKKRFEKFLSDYVTKWGTD